MANGHPFQQAERMTVPLPCRGYLREASLSRGRVAFVAGDDLWLSDLAGTPQCLTRGHAPLLDGVRLAYARRSDLWHMNLETFEMRPGGSVGASSSQAAHLVRSRRVSKVAASGA